MKTLNPLGLQFQRELQIARVKSDKRAATLAKTKKFHVVGAGGTITAAYEQLRNAAENAEENLLIQRAIRRFYKRIMLTPDNKRLASSGEELILELTLAGYLENDSVSEKTVAKINQIATDYGAARRSFGQKHMPAKQIDHWTLDVLCVEVEAQLRDYTRLTALTDLAYSYFLQVLDPKAIFGKKPHNYEVSLFVAIHRSLLKSDPAMTRFSLLKRYRQTPKDPTTWAHTNSRIDEIFESETTSQLTKIVDRRGATFRILLKAMENNADLDAVLSSHKAFVGLYDNEISNTYTSISQNINRGIIRSVLFLIITKFLIGVAIEVPYDLIVNGVIMWLPLVINLLFPPLYMLLLRATLIMPGAANTRALASEIEQILYGQPDQLQLSRKSSSRSFGIGYNMAYALIILIIFGGVGYGLWLIGFEWIHLVIFFIFISAASFLGFRLSRLIREIEIVDGTENAVTMLRDFLYMPFVAVGRGISNAYAQINLVSLILDMCVELPMKTILRLIRQWGAFMSAKKDEL